MREEKNIRIFGNGYGNYMLCRDCYYLDTDSVNIDKHPKCKAFPDGIPRIVWKGLEDHSKNINGDRGICYESALDKLSTLQGEERLNLLKNLAEERSFNAYEIYNDAFI